MTVIDRYFGKKNRSWKIVADLSKIQPTAIVYLLKQSATHPASHETIHRGYKHLQESSLLSFSQQQSSEKT